MGIFAYNKLHWRTLRTPILTNRSCLSPKLDNLINPLRPHDAFKHHFTSLKTDLIRENETGLPIIHGNFLEFLNHIKSYKSTASRELRQQFAAYSGWRWQWWTRSGLKDLSNRLSQATLSISLIVLFGFYLVWNLNLYTALAGQGLIHPDDGTAVHIPGWMKMIQNTQVLKGLKQKLCLIVYNWFTTWSITLFILTDQFWHQCSYCWNAEQRRERNHRHYKK